MRLLADDVRPCVHSYRGVPAFGAAGDHGNLELYENSPHDA